MKKLIYIPLAAVMLTACAAENPAPEYTSAAAETTVPTTALTLTESLTTEVITEPVQEIQPIELAVFDPFADTVKVDDETYKEITAAVEKISDARALFYANKTGFYNTNYSDIEYIDENNIPERNDEEEYCYNAVRPEFAKDEKELLEYFRSVFTEDYISDDDMYAELFESTVGINNMPIPNYKTIDGVLCMRSMYLGVMPAVVYDDFFITEYNDATVKLIVEAEGVSDDPERFFITLKKSDEYGWRLDELSYEEYFGDEAALLYNAVTLRTETLNKILGGGNVPEKPLTTVVDGIEYTEADVGMSLAEMQAFFEETFFRKNIDCAGYADFTVTEAPLLDEYMRKYINEVYAEIDGTVYRRNDAPRWYLPELKIDPLKYYNEQSFIDNGEEIPAEVYIYCECVYNIDSKPTYLKIQIASELPIREFE
ncbi:MAG: hypothetical protein J6C96_04920 [Oscillospiraceae bacterium]|nr:hypothetical protein [Oscillospiraceae bacterium]